MRKGILVLGFVLCGWPVLANATPRFEVPHPIGRDTWITDADYPPNSGPGTVSYKVMIGINGSPTSCEITRSSGSADLDNITCQLIMTRAKFSPASVDGKPAEGSYFGTVQWRNRPGVPFTVVARNSIIEFDVDARGKISNCAVDGAKIRDEMTFCRYYDRVAVPAGEAQLRNVHVRQTTRVEVTAH